MHYAPQTVLITGATGDFGKEFARRFSQSGAKLILHGRDKDKLHKLKEELGGQVHTICFDMSDKKKMASELEHIPADFRMIDLLINNAGGAHGLVKFQEGAFEDFDAMIEANVIGLVHLTRLILPHMIERQRGHVINIGSTAGNWPYPSGHVYGAAKAFVKHFSLALRSDLQGSKVRVTNIEPGMVKTQFSMVRFKGDQEKADAVYANTNPLLAEDIGEAVFWAAHLPEHMTITTMEIMPTTQSLAGFAVERFK